MRIPLTWILFMILTLVRIEPVSSQILHQTSYNSGDQKVDTAQHIPKHADNPENDEQIISVRITSSVAVGRGTGKIKQELSPPNKINAETTIYPVTTTAVDVTGSFPTATNYDILTSTYETLEPITDLPPHLAGANIEYIKQLQAKKDTQAFMHSERIYPNRQSENNSNETVDSVAEPSIQNASIIEDKDAELDDDIPLARSIPLSYSSKSYIHRQGHNDQKLTTVSFNVVHDTPKLLDYNDHSQTYMNPSQPEGPPKYYNEPSKVYSQPAQVYSEPAKFYSEPAKIYSEPAKVYSEPARIYSEPSKIYSEPAKFYSEPASLHLRPEKIPTSRNPWLQRTDTTAYSSSYSTTPSNVITNPTYSDEQRLTEHQPEKNYEVDEKISVMTDGRSHGIQSNNPENCKQENCKVGYVVEGRQYRKYRVEERTSDGFIVGEYGVVRNEDGALRGVRYTADSEASPRLIHDALMKFLQLK